MGAPKGNSFWQARSKHGREKIFNSPDVLWEEACKYFDWCDKNPWIKEDWVGKDAERVERKTQRPYTIGGLCLFLDIDEQTFDNYGKKVEYKDFFGIITRIRNVIYTQKFEGAAVGAYNASIIARDLGLKENTDITSKGKELKAPPPVLFISADKLTDEQLEKYMNRDAGPDDESI